LLAFEIVDKPTVKQKRCSQDRDIYFTPTIVTTYCQKKLDYEELQCSLAPVFIAGKAMTKYSTAHSNWCTVVCSMQVVYVPHRQQKTNKFVIYGRVRRGDKHD
jgi:hypothetical protein